MNKNKGQQGERIACDFLLKQGYRILDKNFRIKEGEIDIICSLDKEIIFVEVKTRFSTKYGFAEEAVTPRKIKTIRKVANRYLQTTNSFYSSIRFDVIAIQVIDGIAEINHLKSAY